MPPSNATPSSRAAASTSSCLAKVTHAPKENSLTLRPALPRRRYSIVDVRGVLSVGGDISANADGSRKRAAWETKKKMLKVDHINIHASDLPAMIRFLEA